MSTCAEPTRAHLSFPTPREGDSSSRAVRCVGLDGKTTTVSDRNTSTGNSCAAEWFAQSAPLNRAASLLPFLPQRGCLAPLCDYPAWTKSMLLTLRNGTATTRLGRLAVNLLTVHELPSAARGRALTEGGFGGYAGILKGGSRCVDSTAKASGSVPGTLENQWRELGS